MSRDDREHVFVTNGGVTVHDDRRCWCCDDEDTAAMRRPDLMYLLEAARHRNLAAQNLAKPVDRRPIDGDRDE